MRHVFARKGAFLKRWMVVVVALTAGVTMTLAGEKNPATDWMPAAKVGVFMHFLPSQTSYPLVDAFDVPAVTRQVVESGARYFVFTLGQNSGYMNAPNATYERLAGFEPYARCARRDLPKELAAALAPHGINPATGPVGSFDSAQLKQLKAVAVATGQSR